MSGDGLGASEVNYADLEFSCACGFWRRWENVPAGQTRTASHNCPVTPPGTGLPATAAKPDPEARGG